MSPPLPSARIHPGLLLAVLTLAGGAAPAAAAVAAFSATHGAVRQAAPRPPADSAARPGPADDGEQEGVPGDSTSLRSDARRAQARFEWIRVRHLPRTIASPSGECHERIGRMCFWHDEEDDWWPPPEAPEITTARSELLAALEGSARVIPGDDWILGQRVYYLGEAGRWDEAVFLAGLCGVPERWWCSALEGYALHRLGRYVEAESSFRRALSEMDQANRARWSSTDELVEGPVRDALGDSSDEERGALEDLLWTLSDPYLLEPGNDRWTEHMARMTVGRVKERAENPYGLNWGRDLQELLVRYGWETGWQQARGGVGEILGRSVVGHQRSDAVWWLPPAFVLADPTGVAPEAWDVDVPRPRSAYAPEYAGTFVPLDAQIARFRRGDSMLVVAAFSLPPDPDLASSPIGSPGNEGAGTTGTGWQAGPRPAAFRNGPGLEAGLFLVEDAVGPVSEVRVRDRAEAVLTLSAPRGRYVVSLEVADRESGRGGRVRGGLSQDPFLEDVPVLSDLLVIRGGEVLPDDLDGAIPRARPGLSVAALEPLGLAWEIYGLGPGIESLDLRITVTRSDRGFVRRAGEWLRIFDREPPLQVAWTEPGPGRRGPFFRAAELDLRNLAEGTYELRLEMRLQGRSAIHASRTLEVR